MGIRVTFERLADGAPASDQRVQQLQDALNKQFQSMLKVGANGTPPYTAQIDECLAALASNIADGKHSLNEDASVLEAVRMARRLAPHGR